MPRQPASAPGRQVERRLRQCHRIARGRKTVHQPSRQQRLDQRGQERNGRRDREQAGCANGHCLLIVMPALVAGIHVLNAACEKTWMAGSSPAMTKNVQVGIAYSAVLRRITLR